MSNKGDMPAFPVPDNVAWDKTNDTATAGMTLRDWFAGQVLGGVWSGRESDFVKIIDPTAQNMADSAYRIADAMLKAREAEQE